MNKMLRDIGSLLLAQIKAPTLMFDVPSFHKLTITNIEVRPRELTNDFYNLKEEGPPIEMPARAIIDGFAGKQRTDQFYLGINLENQVIESARWQNLFYHDSGDSGELGTILLGLPTVLLTAPVWASHNLFWAGFKPVTGMDHHTYFLFKKLEPQLPSELRDDLKQAFINHCNGVEENHLTNIHGRGIRQ